MGRLIIVAGASGAGKTFFMRQWQKKDEPNTEIIKKFVSKERAPRKYEIVNGNSDLIFSKMYDPTTPEGKEWYNSHYPGITVSEKLKFHPKKYNLSEIDDSLLGYYYNNTYYEIDRDKLIDALKNGKNPIVVVRDIDTILRLFENYPNALLIHVVSGLSGMDLSAALKKLDEDDIDITERMERTNDDLRELADNISRFKSYQIAVNDFDPSNKSIVYKFIRHIYEKEVENYTHSQRIFLIQSYADKNNKIMVRNSIKSAFLSIFHKEPELVVADEKRGAFPIPEYVWRLVHDIDYIICDIVVDRCYDDCPDPNKRVKQGVSPNVWLELGGAIAARGKKIIILRKNDGNVSPELPTDINSYNYLDYTGPADLTPALEKELKELFE